MVKRAIHSIVWCLLALHLLAAQALAQNTPLDSLKRALKTAQSDTLQVYLHNEIARLLMPTKPDTALIIARQSLAIAGHKEMKGLTASTNMICAVAFNSLGSRDSAEYHFKKAILLAVKYKRSSVEAASYLGLGTCYNMWKKHDRSLQNYLLAYKMFSSLGDSAKMASAALGIGNVYSDLNNISKAQEYFTVALKSAISRKDNRFIAKCYNNLGNLFQRSKAYDKAFEYYTKSIEIKKLLNDEHGIANTYLNFGNIYTLTNKPDLALLFYGRACDIYLKLGDSASYMGGLTYMGECYLKQNKIKEAVAHLTKAEGICLRNHYTVDLAGIYGALTKVYILRGDTALARRTLEKYTAVKDTLLAKDMQKQIAQITAQFESDKQRHEQAIKEIENEAEKKVNTAYLEATLIVCVVLVILAFMINKFRKLKKSVDEDVRDTQKNDRA